MNFLLKIVQGPNSGAEIALIDGVNLTFGCADDCDIILNDASVGEKAFELEVTGERVVAVMPGGKTVKFEPYHVILVGTTALVVGPQEGEWKSLVWPKVEAESEAEKLDLNEAATEEKDDASVKRRSPLGCAAVIFLLLIIAATAIFAWRKYPEETKDYSLKAYSKTKEIWCVALEKFKSKPAEEAVVFKESLDDVARDCAFIVIRNGEAVSVKGDFPTRVKRLEATARACAAHPGLKIDFSDIESLSSAVCEFLFLVTEDKLKLEKIEGRKAFISGRIASRESLEKILRALSEDVPKVSEVDCSQVAFSIAAGLDSSDGGDDETAPIVYHNKFQERKHEPKMPIAGILTVPYPCLVLNDGTRAMEGARFGEYTIEKITPESITVRGAEGSFEWRP